MPTVAAYIVLFIIYSILGALAETFFRLITEHQWYGVHGFLHLPILPIYGFGALIIILIGRYFRNPLVLFIIGGLATTALEFVSHWLIEGIFDIHIWGYGDDTFTIQGRVSLISSIGFGIASILLVHSVHPRIVGLLERLPRHTIIVVAALTGGIVLFDIIYSIMERLQG